MGNRIFRALEHLPAHLVTDEIAAAGIEEGDIRILNLLPERYLTMETIEALIAKNEGSWYGFGLEKIPERARTKEVCEFAVAKDVKNFSHAPDKLKSKTMLAELTVNPHNKFGLLSSIPAELWDREMVYKAIRSICYAKDTPYCFFGSAEGRIQMIYSLLLPLKRIRLTKKEDRLKSNF